MIAFTAHELAAARRAGATGVAFHDAISAPPASCGPVDVHVPAYRGHSLLPVLAWLAARLSCGGETVSWHAGMRQGPDTIRRLLEGMGWRLDRERAGRMVRLRGPAPEPGERPEPRGFATVLAGQEVRLLADYGVFSPDHIDDGTALLLDVGLRRPRVDQVADIGVGYGPLAIGLVRAGVAASAIGADVDSIALWLAAENARACGVRLTPVCTDDPVAVLPTRLTVCNVPTHIDRRQTERLMAGLADRARGGVLLAVVHASLEARYTRHLEAAALRVSRHPDAAHVVLEAAAPRR